MDELGGRLGVPIASLPTGHGLLIKNLVADVSEPLRQCLTGNPAIRISARPPLRND